MLSQWSAGVSCFLGCVGHFDVRGLVILLKCSLLNGKNSETLTLICFCFAPQTVPCCKLKSHIPECKPIMFPMEISGILVATFKMWKSIYFFFHLFFFPALGTDSVHLHRDHHGMLPLRRPLFLWVCELQCSGGYWSSPAFVQSEPSHKNTPDQLEPYCKFIPILTPLKIAANLV